MEAVWGCESCPPMQTDWHHVRSAAKPCCTMHIQYLCSYYDNDNNNKLGAPAVLPYPSTPQALEVVSPSYSDTSPVLLLCTKKPRLGIFSMLISNSTDLSCLRVKSPLWPMPHTDIYLSPLSPVLPVQSICFYPLIYLFTD